jgi:hypothetical protein
VRHDDAERPEPAPYAEPWPHRRTSPYPGPPPSNPPPAGWRPEHVLAPAAPRTLPVQNHDAIDAVERRARQLTKAITVAAGAVLLVLLCALCIRTLF